VGGRAGPASGRWARGRRRAGERPEGFDATLAAAQRGDAGAWRQLYDLVGPALLRYLAGSGATSAEDVAADVWAEVAVRLAEFVGDENDFRAFVFTRARWRRVDDWRRSRRRVLLEQGADEGQSVGEGTDAAGASPSAEGDVLGRLSASDAVAYVRRVLPPDQADAVLLRHLAGLEVKEVATAMNRSEGAVRVLVHRGLHRLAETLGHDGAAAVTQRGWTSVS